MPQVKEWQARPRGAAGRVRLGERGAGFWLSVLTDLQQQGVQDMLVACIDNLKGFAEAIASVFPQAEVQSCIVHQIRSSLK